MSNEVRPAATVVVMRPRRADDPTPELYMLRRSSKSAFMPDALVFPGGRVESEDGVEEDSAFAQAALRECQEEASLSLGLQGLRWFDTWKTPSGESPRRFLARFYLTTISPGEGLEAEADGVETHAGRWASAEDILAQWRAELVDLPPPTLCVLLGLAEGRAPAWSSREPAEAREPILPKIAAIDNQIHIVMPHDPEYTSLPGDEGPVPQRVRTLPRRFARIGKRWVPQT